MPGGVSPMTHQHLQISGAVSPITHQYHPRWQNPQHQLCRNLKSQTSQMFVLSGYAAVFPWHASSASWIRFWTAPFCTSGTYLKICDTMTVLCHWYVIYLSYPRTSVINGFNDVTFPYVHSPNVGCMELYHAFTETLGVRIALYSDQHVRDYRYWFTAQIDFCASPPLPGWLRGIPSPPFNRHWQLPVLH